MSKVKTKTKQISKKPENLEQMLLDKEAMCNHLGCVIDAYKDAFYGNSDPMVAAKAIRTVDGYEAVLNSLHKDDPRRMKLQNYLANARAHAVKIGRHLESEEEEIEGLKERYEQQRTGQELQEEEKLSWYENTLKFKEGKFFRGIPAAVGAIAGWLGYQDPILASFAAGTCYALSEGVLQFGCRYGIKKLKREFHKKYTELSNQFNELVKKSKKRWKLKRRSEYRDAERICGCGNKTDHERQKTMADILAQGKDEEPEINFAHAVPRKVRV